METVLHNNLPGHGPETVSNDFRTYGQMSHSLIAGGQTPRTWHNPHL